MIPAVYGHDFMVRAVIAALLAGALLGALSHVVVLRRQAFLSTAIGQTALTGLSVGVLLGEPVGAAYGGTLGTCLLAALLLVYVERRGDAPRDTVIGVFVAVALGLGVCLLRAVGQRFDVHQLEAVMFGSLLTVTALDLAVLGAVGLLALGVAGWAYNASIVAAVSPDLARARRAPAALYEYAMVVALTLAIVASLEIVGSLLVEAMILVPAAAARAGARSLRAYLVGAVVVAVVGAQAGLYASSVWAVPSGGAVVLALVALFAAALAGAGAARAIGAARRANLAAASIAAARGGAGEARANTGEARAPRGEATVSRATREVGAG